MTELLLDDVDRHSLCRKLGGVGVTQAVGVDALLDARLSSQAGEEPADVGGIERLAGECAEDRPPPREPDGSAAIEPALEQGEGRGVHPDRAPPVALAVEDREGALGDVDVLREEGEGFGDAQAAAVEDGDEGTVANAGRRPRGAGPQEGSDLVGGEELGGEAAVLIGGGAAHRSRRIVWDSPTTSTRRKPSRS